MSRTKFTDIDSLSLQDLEQDAELIPLMTPEDEEEINKEQVKVTGVLLGQVCKHDFMN
mgnify:CR=1 FL=1